MQRVPCIEHIAISRPSEGDLLPQAKHTYIATIMEPTSRYVLLVRITGKDTTTVVTPLIR